MKMSNLLSVFNFFIMFYAESINSVKIRETVYVDLNGGQRFKSIREAVRAAPINTRVQDGFFRIIVGPGVYSDEYIYIGAIQKNIMLVGQGKEKTIITGNKSKMGGWEPHVTYTFGVAGRSFVAINVTFRNTAGPESIQAIAVRNLADESAYYNCSFEGYQDTLYAEAGKQFYRDCDIYGTIDFIFGNALAVFQNCLIYARVPIGEQHNVIVAQGRRSATEPTGFSFQRCSIFAAGDLRSIKTYLGRPWKDFSRVIYMQSSIDSLIYPTGWSIWDNNTNTNLLYFGEYNNKGPGAILKNRVRWHGFHKLNREEANNFTVSNFISGDLWLPLTGIRFYGGLYDL